MWQLTCDEEGSYLEHQFVASRSWIGLTSPVSRQDSLSLAKGLESAECE
jgi:hypothetical protein